MHVLTCKLWLPLSQEDCFEFFSDAGNLPRITPPWLRFRIVTPGEIHLAPGTLIDYTIRVMGLPMKWRTRIDDFSPPVRFIDRQLRGPYALWHHLHTFEPYAGGTLIADTVHYDPGKWLLGRVLNACMIRRQLRGIFEYRQQTIAEILLGPRQSEARVVEPVAFHYSSRLPELSQIALPARRA